MLEFKELYAKAEYAQNLITYFLIALLICSVVLQGIMSLDHLQHPYKGSLKRTLIVTAISGLIGLTSIVHTFIKPQLVIKHAVHMYRSQTE